MRVFLDANILFSASNSGSNIRDLVMRLIRDHSVVSSYYSREEAMRNLLLKRPAWESDCLELIQSIQIVRGLDRVVPVEICSKDRPILASALQAQCDFLLTGDRKDFGHLIGDKVGSLQIVTPLLMAEILIQDVRSDSNRSRP
jgi:predicted nucleic acid-binding protein